MIDEQGLRVLQSMPGRSREIAAKAQLSQSELNAVLAELELFRFVSRDGGGYRATPEGIARMRVETLIRRNWLELRAEIRDMSSDVLLVQASAGLARATSLDHDTALRVAQTIGLPVNRQRKMRELRNSLGQWVLVTGNVRPEAFVIYGLPGCAPIRREVP